MLQKLRLKICSFHAYLKEIPRACLIVCTALLLGALFIRFFTKQACPPITALAHRGIFPSTLPYCIFHALRLICAGILLSSSIFAACVENRAKSIACAALLCLLLLLEYKVIFGMTKILLATVLCLAAAAAAFFCLIFQRLHSKAVTVSTFVFLIMQTMLFIQLVTLMVCM
ncbi:MAG: hypothetical protein ACI3YE_01145 [Candidatus Avispirillum sp.]